MDFMSGIWKVGAKAKEILNLEKDAAGETKEPVENTKITSPVQEVVGKGDAVSAAEAKASSSPESEGPDSKPATPESPHEQKESKENIELDEAEASAQIPGVDLKQVKDVTKDVSHKAVEGAKYFGSFLYSVANKAGKTVTETAKQIKHTVEENSILGEFNREQEAFVNSRKQSEAKETAGVAPWVGCVDEDGVKQQVLSLSADKRNFVRSPPSGVSFQFELADMLPVAATMLKEDPNLEKMRFELVPKHITEENFWRNYFYRVSLVKQSASLAHQKSSSGDSSDWSRKSSDEEGPDKIADEESPSAEFASDDHQGATGVSAKDLASGMSQLGVRPAGAAQQPDEDLEQELQQALQDYEVVQEDEPDPELENELERMIAS